MAAYLPFVLQNIFNTPLALSSAKAEVIIAAMAGRLNIQALVDESLRMDDRALRDLAALGRRGEVEGAPNAKKQQVQEPAAMLAGIDVDDRPYHLTESGTALIQIQGTLTRTWGVGPFSGKTGYDSIWTQMLYAQSDPLCRRIWMEINSGGGVVDGLIDCADGVYSMSARNGGKPIHAHASDFAFSAAYTIMAAADTTSCPETGMVGSIAAMMVHIDMTKAMAEEGLEAIIFRSGKRKNIGVGGIEPLDAEEMKHRQDLVDGVGAVVVDRVAKYLGKPTSAISKLEGLDYRGPDAKAIGLVNYVMSEPEAWAKHERRAA